ncbi:hypothetical protein [Pseudoalteromonas lipolytica]|uniref:hypothetical protein n=1 Tax=Pseudoalteromonas lipolytica TaxID=570156 RepID=UPI000C4DAEFE|nr:hypothetical protein [Pseudoalteromonas lipolytica]MAE02348.1 SppA protein [Pseudoalteromonas sp.]|tara:strand:+ start:581 stop:1447 length:867 start_codon:yes stop_codon:yes gene_type:complete
MEPLLETSVKSIRDKYDADIFLFSGNLTAHADDMFINIVEMQENKKNNVILFLQTLGGVPDIGYRIARYLKNEYKNVYYAIGGLCKSTGTLMSISANTLIMGKRGEFGPLDIQIAKKDEVGELASGLNIFQALEFLDEQARSIVANTFVELRNGAGLSTKQAFDVAQRMATNSLSPIYAQIEPVRLGEFKRAMQIAEQYGSNLNSGNLKDKALNRLISTYPSHGYVIDRNESKELFDKVEDASIEFEHLMRTIRTLNITELYCRNLVQDFIVPDANEEDENDGKSDES